MALREIKDIEKIPEDLRKEIRLLDATFAGKFIDKDIVVYRYMGYFDDLGELDENDIFTDWGYMSTTCSLDYASQL
ncbi:MAG: hypothetical protein KKF16_06195 [Euryarchaeota archaeon]|nr:hypothetical protein [Euryarchaeota archaeon]MBV1730490.1 hypothetical protein [Methanobacterium sp.]MBU4547462.1 hypothetical protein [Euryarchaeota archaeon]MBU4608106.1 hypothetical protein [Euryarchaeota archaeon]MBV1754227.1 hypothetical protein [Methanobacterium sp.]